MYIKAILLSTLLILSFSYEEQGNVLVLHDADFPQVLSDFPFILIEFYAPWCGHCQKLAPIFTQVADQLKAQGSEVRLAKVDATIDKNSAAKYKVQGYPTIFFFHKGDPIDYKGQRTKQFMVNWLSKKTRDPLIPADQETYQKLQSEDKVSIVYHGDASSQGATIVNKLAVSDDFNTYYIASVGKEQGTVQIFRPFASVQTTRANQNLSSWVAKHERPTVVPFDQRTIGQIFSSQKAGACLFNVGGSNVLLDSFTTAAKAYLQSGRQLIFCQIAQDSQHLQQFAEYIKTKPQSMPVVLIQSKIKSKFVLQKDPSDLTSEDVLEFLNNWHSGKANKLGITDQVPSEEQLPEQL